MNKPTIADSAIYQHTARMASKYKAQRDELLVALREIVEAGDNIAYGDDTFAAMNRFNEADDAARVAINKVGQSL